MPDTAVPCEPVAQAAVLIEPLTGRAIGSATGRAIAVPAVVVALIIGMLLHGVARKRVFQPGMTYSVKKLLRIAIALLGRNHPIGIAIGALLFAWLDQQSNPLQILLDVSPDIVKVTQGVIVLTVVIAYEVVRRYGVRLEQRHVAAALDPQLQQKGVSA